MEFEFDKAKSAANKSKHGIDFIEAQLLWGDPDRIEIPARTEDGSRIVVIGRISSRHYSAIVTLRKGNIRIISIRRSRKEEIEIYES